MGDQEQEDGDLTGSVKGDGSGAGSRSAVHSSASSRGFDGIKGEKKLQAKNQQFKS